jgi:hypothetical protein
MPLRIGRFFWRIDKGKRHYGVLKAFLGESIRNPDSLLFHSRRGSPLHETNVLRDGLHPAIRTLGFRQPGMRAFRHGCNRRWNLPE